MKSTIASLFTSFAVFIALAAMPVATYADTLFVNQSGVLSEFTTAGAPINTLLATNLTQSPGSLAASGGDLFVAQNDGTIGEYDASGTLVNGALISGANAYAIAVSGNNLFVYNGASISEYTTSGTLVHPSLVTGLSNGVGGIAVSGGDIFVSNNFDPINDTFGTTISTFDASSGALLNPSFITGLSGPDGIAVSGGNLFVTNEGFESSIGEYTTAGATVNASLVPNGVPQLPRDIVVSGNSLFVANAVLPGSGFISEYDATTGGTINGLLVSGQFGPTISVAVVQTPEPSTMIMFVIGAVALFARGLRKRRSQA
jgi:PEP-CTERM motif